MLTLHELQYLILEPFLPVLYARVRQDLRRLLISLPQPVHLLDVGARNSPYTIGLAVQVTLLDIPRETEVQKTLSLGWNKNMMAALPRKRSNVVSLVLEDMTCCTLADNSFDIVTCIEVIEHVAEDELFVKQICRVLKPGGLLYLTTPNGDYIRNEPPNYNPDHLRHYTGLQLTELLQRHFSQVDVYYGVKTGKHRYRGLAGISPARPLQSIKTAISNIANRIESRGLEKTSQRTAHLFAVAHKALI